MVRQSAQLDLGVWRLDAPTHPEGDEAPAQVKRFVRYGASARA